MTTTPDIEAVIGRLGTILSGANDLPYIRMVARDALATITALQARVAEAEQDRDHEAWMVEQLDNRIRDYRSQLAASQAEVLEQARLVGMGSEREAGLMAQVAASQAEVARVTKIIDACVAESATCWANLVEAGSRANTLRADLAAHKAAVGEG